MTSDVLKQGYDVTVSQVRTQMMQLGDPVNSCFCFQISTTDYPSVTQLICTVYFIADFVKQNEHKFQPPQKSGEELPVQEK